MSGAGAVLVVGVGGIGAPCAWALAHAGVSRLILVDGDVVEPSNLPRQVLFAPRDVGRPKAEVAAGRLARPGLSIEPVVGTFDARTGPSLLARAAVAVDATDGAATKDLVNALAVAARVPLVHAAAVGSEGRVLDGPPGGRPCIACLFGRLSDAAGDPAAAGTCADLGVWNGVTGAVGFLAARAALLRLRSPAAPSTGLRVLDFGAGRCATLAAEADPACPACGARAGVSPAKAAEVEGAAARCVAAASAPEGAALDLSREACPMNLLRARRALDPLPEGADLEILLGVDGAATVPESLEAMGHRILRREAEGEGLRLVVRKTGAAPVRKTGVARARPASGPGSEDWLRRFARQIVLPEVGEEGQRKIAASRVLAAGAGDALVAAAVYLAACGVGEVVLHDPTATEGADAGCWPFPASAAGLRRDEALAAALSSEGVGALCGATHDPVAAAASADACVVAGGPASLARAIASASQRAGKGRPFAAALAGSAGGMVVSATVPEDADDGAGAGEGPVARAAACAAADAVLRRLVRAAPWRGDLLFRDDATVGGV